MASLCNITKEHFLSKNYLKNETWKLVQVLFNFKDFSKKGIWGFQCADLDKFGQFCHYISSVSSLLQKFHFPLEVVLNSLQTQEGLGTSFQVTVLVEFFDKIFSFVI